MFEAIFNANGGSLQNLVYSARLVHLVGHPVPQPLLIVLHSLRFMAVRPVLNTIGMLVVDLVKKGRLDYLLAILETLVWFSGVYFAKRSPKWGVQTPGKITNAYMKYVFVISLTLRSNLAKF